MALRGSQDEAAVVSSADLKPRFRIALIQGIAQAVWALATGLKNKSLLVAVLWRFPLWDVIVLHSIILV